MGSSPLLVIILIPVGLVGLIGTAWAFAARPGAGDLPGCDRLGHLGSCRRRYEPICNLPGHYAMGMFTELDVS